ncbi:CDGSH iron-sulfur domain-containing protein [Streptomyces sp. NPDC048511]|uniref:CDGSH iron-sulfur domain-containing protein n=1 Tax=Streptomyces sp. NPDC048511 TaxID=3365562 RepID=UPI003717E857
MTVDGNGPILIEGPVAIVREDGTIATPDRFVVAVCTCRRSRMYPWCDTSHRRRTKPPGPGRREGRDRRSGRNAKETRNGDDH